MPKKDAKKPDCHGDVERIRREDHTHEMGERTSEAPASREFSDSELEAVVGGAKKSVGVKKDS